MHTYVHAHTYIHTYYSTYYILLCDRIGNIHINMHVSVHNLKLNVQYTTVVSMTWRVLQVRGTQLYIANFFPS